MRIKKDLSISLLLLIPASVIFFLSSEFPLFWDTIQFAGKHALFYFDNNFSSFFLPESIDSAHFPIFGMYLAALWMIFGKSLFVSHLAMFPIIFLNLFLAFRLGRVWTRDYYSALLFPLLLLAIPAGISQFMLVSPDIALLCFFLAVLYSIEAKSDKCITLASIALGLISLRGALILFALIFWQGLIKRHSEQPSLYVRSGPYLPAIILILLYHLAHKFFTGWILFHDNMPWYESFDLVSAKSVLRNIFVYGWRLVDFGMVFIWTGLLLQFIKGRRSLFQEGYVWLLVILILLFAFVTIPFSGLMQHRYFLPVYVLAGFIFIRNLELNKGNKMHKITVLFLAGMGLISGNFWIYPDKISQGWDVTLAHLPYYSLQADVMDYINKCDIDYDNIGTEFPMRSPFRELFLNDSRLQFATANLKDQDYILWSNVMNDFSDAEIEELRNEWYELNSMKKCGVKMILYQKIKE